MEPLLGSKGPLEVIRDQISGNYYNALNECKVITFDSGEVAPRRKFISAALKYCINYKGLPTVVLSAIDPQITLAFLMKTPVVIREKVLEIGLFHVYIDMVTRTREMMQKLYVSPYYRRYMEYYFCSLRSIEADLIQKLHSKGLVVILDRSIISSWLYNKSMGPKDQIGTAWDQVFDISHFRPLCCFFIHSPLDKSSGDIGEASLYDADPGINFEVRSHIPGLKKHLPYLVEIETHLHTDDAISKICESINNCF